MSNLNEFLLQTPEFSELNKKLDRRNFLSKTAGGLGALALSGLLSNSVDAKSTEQLIMNALPKIAPKAKRVVYLFMAGGPSQFETFDFKPKLLNMFGKALPDSVRKGQRLTGMSANQAVLPIVPSVFNFKEYG